MQPKSTAPKAVRTAAAKPPRTMEAKVASGTRSSSHPLQLAREVRRGTGTRASVRESSQSVLLGRSKKRGREVGGRDGSDDAQAGKRGASKQTRTVSSKGEQRTCSRAKRVGESMCVVEPVELEEGEEETVSREVASHAAEFIALLKGRRRVAFESAKQYAHGLIAKREGGLFGGDEDLSDSDLLYEDSVTDSRNGSGDDSSSASSVSADRFAEVTEDVAQGARSERRRAPATPTAGKRGGALFTSNSEMWADDE